MQKTIASKLYDTETATCLRKVTSGFFGDPAGYEETLYCTPEGYYFLYTNGGEASPYREERITRLSRARAEEFLHK